jgi:hypothetical protein
VYGVARYRTAAAAARAERATAIGVQILLTALAATVLGVGALVTTTVPRPPEPAAPSHPSAGAR